MAFRNTAKVYKKGVGYNLQLSSDDPSNVDGSVSHDFTTFFADALKFGETRWCISLIGLNLWFSNYNVSDDYANRVFRYNNGSGWKSFSIESGNYEITQLIEAISSGITALGDTASNIVLNPNYNTGRVEQILLASYEIDWSISTLNNIFGAESRVYTSADDGGYSSTADITNGVNTFMLSIDLLDGSIAGAKASQVLYTFTPNVAPSSSIRVEPNFKIPVMVKLQEYVNSIRVRVIDQTGRPINLNGEPVTVLLHLAPLGLAKLE